MYGLTQLFTVGAGQPVFEFLEGDIKIVGDMNGGDAVTQIFEASASLLGSRPSRQKAVELCGQLGVAFQNCLWRLLTGSAQFGRPFRATRVSVHARARAPSTPRRSARVASPNGTVTALAVDGQGSEQNQRHSFYDSFHGRPPLPCKWVSYR